MHTKVLVIEDVKIAQLNAVNILEKLNCDITVAPNAATALDLLLTDRFDLIFTDIELPDISGLDITTTVRMLEKNRKHIPIIAVTAYYDEEIEKKCKSMGCDDFLLKPLTIESVRYTLKKYSTLLR